MILLGNTSNLDGGKDHLFVQSRTQLTGEDIMSDIYIDLNSLKEFTEDHLQTYKRLNQEQKLKLIMRKLVNYKIQSWERLQKLDTTI